MPKKPWNIIDAPVYSLATLCGPTLNMNICTYVSAVSMKPKRYMVAVYHGTQSWHNMQLQDKAVLQLLTTKQTALVRVLGNKSGSTYNKHAYLTRNKHLFTWHDNLVLTHAAAWLQLQKLEVTNAGDHDMVLFEVVRYKTNTPSDVLTLNHLREKKLVRI
jgi:flavin reductase (DIM6/NTAB) family NADH-FMN oxidoreductase RutF